MLRLNRAYSEERTMRQQRDVLESCGLKARARNVDRLIMQHQVKIEAIKREVMHQREELVKAMLLAFCSADIATSCADLLAAAFDEHTVGVDNEGGNYIADKVREQAKAWNEVVQMIDGDGVSGNERVSMYYADLAEDVVQRVIPIVLETIEQYMGTEKGRRLL